ncbi:MAG: zinc ribbon domain-containing protein [Gemmatimonadales bacterium]|nr:MAG: zinc ribbon domain-containing protein [Gemmatimonadales bacterium]
MPRYDFVCQDCGTAFEARLSMSAYDAGEGRQCPSCGSERAERSFSVVNVIAGGGKGLGSSAAPTGGSCGFGGFT